MILVPFIATGAFYLIGYFADGMNSVDKIAVYANEPAIAQTFVDQSGDDFEFEIVDSEEQGQQQMATKMLMLCYLLLLLGIRCKGNY